MYIFCFNDCIPREENNHILITSLGNTLGEYNKVKNKFPENVDGIITSDQPSGIILNNNNFSLYDCIHELERSLRIIAHRSFSRYPIAQNLVINDEDKLIEGDFTIEVNSISYNAINATIVAENNGVLFTLALHNDLKRNRLLIENTGKNITVLNLYGEDSNTKFICEEIDKSIAKNLNNYERFCALIGDCIVSDRFRKAFGVLSIEMQEVVIKHFEEAINRNGHSRFFSDGNLIKNVTPEKETDIDILELRIFSPVAYRIYFYETITKVYFAALERKPAPRVQDGQIKNAISIIKQLILLDK